MCDFSISIVTYNNSKIIGKTLKDLVSNIDKRLNYIVYVLDNNSEDSTLEIARSISGNIKIIDNKKNIGFGAGHNRILGELDSKYHIVMNPDITITNNIIFEMYEFLEKRPDIGLLSPLVKHEDGRIQFLCKQNPTFLDLFIRLVTPNLFKNRQNRYTMMETNYNKEFTFDYATGCFMVFRTDIFRKINGFDENFFMYLEDADISRRVNQISRTVFYPYNHVVHGWERGAYKSFKLMWINVQSAFYYFKKWGFRLY